MIRLTYDEIAITFVLSIVILAPLSILINKKIQKSLDKHKSDYINSKKRSSD